ncbi:MAG: hypothetical protein V4726_06060 [Verrucomicrobiota bacterium]
MLLSAVAWIVMGTSLRAQDAGRVPVGMEEFIGGTGESAAQLLRDDLGNSGLLSVVDNPTAGGGWLVRASSSAGRIDGALLDKKGAVLFNKHYDESDLRDNAHAFADDIVSSITGVRGIASTKIAFVSYRTGAPEIYLADSDGGRIQQITSTGTLKGAPSLGPGSILLAYTSYASGFADVMLKDLRTGDERAVLAAPGTNSGATFSADGTRLALTMSFAGDTDIYISTLSGSRCQRVTNSKSVEFSPSWSPDGGRLVFCSDATGSPQLFVVPRAGGEPERLETGYRYTLSPDWSPDGVHIAFTGREKSGPAIMIYDLASGKSRVALSNAQDAAWAPDGRHLVAVQNESLVVVDVVSGQRRTLISGVPHLREPAWSR